MRSSSTALFWTVSRLPSPSPEIRDRTGCSARNRPRGRPGPPETRGPGTKRPGVRVVGTLYGSHGPEFRCPRPWGGPWPGAGPSGIARRGVGRGSECRRGMRSSCPGRIGQGAVAALTGGARFCAECTNPAPLLASVPNRPGPGSAPSGRAGCGAEPHVWRLVAMCCWFVPALRLFPGAKRPLAEQKSRLGERSEP